MSENERLSNDSPSVAIIIALYYTINRPKEFVKIKCSTIERGMSMLLKNAVILRENGEFSQGDLRIKGEVIDAIGQLDVQADEPVHDLNGAYLIPGLIETHFHGAMGLDCSLGTREPFEAFSRYMAERGITSYVPALISSSDEVTERYIEAGNAYMAQSAPGAQMVGFYLEGPFLSHKYKGAHDPNVLQLPSLEKFRHWYQLAGGKILKTVVAPELEGAEELIRWSSSNGVAVEIGHSAATYEQAMKAIDWGATLSTHLFNAMTPLHHRDPGIPGAVLTDPRVNCELIADLGHVAPAVVKLVCMAKGADGINLISDSCTAAGVSDGEYIQPDGRKIIVKDGLARLENGTIMGSASSILDGVRNLVSLGIDLAVAVRMASANPARSIGLSDRGVIAKGKRADMAVLDKDLHVLCTFVDGKKVYNVEES